MAEVLLFHHALGQTDGLHAFAGELREAGHTVHTPDLFDGQRFTSIEAGMAHVEEIGFTEIIARGQGAAEGLSSELVYAGFSLGVVCAQSLAQTRPGAQGALLCYSCVPAAEFGGWPAGLRAQIHAMRDDPLFTDEGDLEAAEALAGAESTVELFLYPGSDHYFADSSLESYDPGAAALLTQRALAFLAGS